MGLSVCTDTDAVGAVARRFLDRDPVRGTFLGTISESFGDGAWAASDAERIAIRSDAEHPLLLHGDWSAAVAELVGVLPPVMGLSGRADVVQVVHTALARPARSITEEGLFRCDDLRPPPGVDGSARRATPDDHDLLVDWVAAFMDEAHAGFDRPAAFVRRALRGCWLWRDGSGAPASLAVRRAAHGGSARIGPVYTPAESRGHGYGSAVTAAATQDVLDEGAIPVLLTDLANPTSNKIYRAIGYREVERRRLVRLAD